MAIEDLYQFAAGHATDIVFHLPRLRWLASLHGRVTEFGVRQGVSTIAMLAGNPNVISYDVDLCDNEGFIRAECPNWTFIQGSTLEVEIDETDMLFIDTVHTYDQLSAELERHAHKVTRTIVLHDTYGVDVDTDVRGMWRAIDESGWRVVFDEPECNGLTVLCES